MRTLIQELEFRHYSESRFATFLDIAGMSVMAVSTGAIMILVLLTLMTVKAGGWFFLFTLTGWLGYMLTVWGQNIVDKKRRQMRENGIDPDHPDQLQETDILNGPQ